MRHWGSVVRLEMDQRAPDRIRDLLLRNLELPPYQVYMFAEPLRLRRPDGAARASTGPTSSTRRSCPAMPAAFAKSESLFELIRRQDVLLYHPYDCFVPVVDFVREAAAGPQRPRHQADALPRRRQLARSSRR